MRMQRPTLYLLVALGLLFCLQLTACGSQGMPGSQGKDGKSQSAQMAGPFSASSQSTTDYAVPPVIVHHPAPGGLEVVFNVNMGGYGADREQTTIGLSFLSHGKVVQLAATSSSCVTGETCQSISSTGLSPGASWNASCW
jgi:hypothetical protein